MKAFLHKYRRLFDLALLLVALLVYLYAHFVERTWLEVTEVEVPCAEWTSDTPLRLAVLADLHARPGDGEYVDEIVRRTLAAKPDAVLLLGDYLNGHHTEQGMPVDELEEHLRPLGALPLYAVLGNHDYYHDTVSVRKMLSGIGAQIVEGRAGGLPVRLEKDGGKVDIGGIRCLYNFKTPGTVPQPRDGVPLVLLSHSPVGARYAAEGTSFVICGHTHGGQIRWPWGGPVYMADGKTPAEHAYGWKEIEGHRTYVTRGLGTSILPIRCFCRPELTIFTISRP